MLVSCATTDKTVSEDIIDQPAEYKYAAWRLEEPDRYEAIKGLLSEADTLIENQDVDAAEDKLERVLRIKPDYAPAWSRLSWLALQTSAPERSIQMARRSNSFAQTDRQLQLLNWAFIRAASQQLHDDETYSHADEKIQSLKD